MKKLTLFVVVLFATMLAVGCVQQKPVEIVSVDELDGFDSSGNTGTAIDEVATTWSASCVVDYEPWEAEVIVDLTTLTIEDGKLCYELHSSEELGSGRVEQLTGDVPTTWGLDVLLPCTDYNYFKVTAKFTDYFIDGYRYEDSKNYMFALKLDGSYYNVFRNTAMGVSNSSAEGLTWARPAFEFKEGVERYVPLNTDVNVANKDTVGYTTRMYTLQDTEAELSPTKEVPGHLIADILVEPICR